MQPQSVIVPPRRMGHGQAACDNLVGFNVNDHATVPAEFTPAVGEISQKQVAQRRVCVGLDEAGIELLHEDYKPRRDDHEVLVQPHFEERVTILYYYPNMQPDIDGALVGGASLDPEVFARIVHFRGGRKDS